MTLSMDIFEDFEEKQKMIVGVRNELMYLKAKLSMKENCVVTTCEKTMNDLFRQLISLKDDLGQKSTKIKKIEEDAAAKNTEFKQRLIKMENHIEEKNKLIDVLQEENKKLTEHLKQLSAMEEELLNNPESASEVSHLANVEVHTIRCHQAMSPKNVLAEGLETESKFLTPLKNPVDQENGYCLLQNKGFFRKYETLSTRKCENNDVESNCLQFTCSTCLASFPSKHSLISHVFTHLEDIPPPPHICRLCGVAFATAESLTEHSLGIGSLAVVPTVKMLSEDSWFCNICQEVFNSKHCVRAHMTEHNGHISSSPQTNERSMSIKVEPHACKVCGKHFSHFCTNKEHYIKHGIQDPYVCVNCNKSFISKSALKSHVRLHVGEKPYVCDVCQRSFSQSSTLIQHKRNHTCKKPYVCDICQRSF